MKLRRTLAVAFLSILFTFSSPANAAAQCGGDLQLACFNEQVCVAPIPGGCVFGACWPETCALFAPDLSRPSCNEGLTPFAGICQHCGGDRQFECPSTGCSAGTTSVLGLCLACGGPQQPVCPGGTCGSWSNNFLGVCIPCGGNDQLHCFQGDACQADHTEVLGFCYSCGGPGLFTCNGTCRSPRLNPIAGLCVACGGMLEPACGVGQECDSGNTPFAGFCVPLDISCGGTGQATCSTGPVCDPFNAPRVLTCEAIPAQPEPETNAIASVPAADSPDAEIFGFADIHAHTLANLGFGGLWFWGAPFHPDGVTYALPWCDFTQEFGKVNQFGLPIPGVPGLGVAVHGTGHALDFVGQAVGQPMLFNGGGASLRHLDIPGSNEGNYDGYPNWKSIDHQSMYYKWIERSFLGGQRLMVLLAVNNETLCQVVDRRSAPGLFGYMNAFGCDDDTSLKRQLVAAKEMESYIERLDGDPDNDSGWFKIAYSAQEARRIINKGKMAVILGLEAATVFNSRGNDGMTPNVDAVVNEYYELGARWIFPIHLWDNDFGGGAINQPVSYVGNQVSAGYSFNTESCGGYEFTEPVGNALFQLLWGLLNLGDPPSLPAPCNALGLTDTGRALLNKLMAKKMIIDVDHLSLKALNDTLAIAEQASYPLVASHVRFFDISHGNERAESAKTDEQLARLRNLGGIVAPVLAPASAAEIDRFDSSTNGVSNDCPGSSKQWAQQYLYGIDRMRGGPHALPPVAFGSDFNAPARHTAPRFDRNHVDSRDGCMGDGAPQANPVTYPFEAFGRPGTQFFRQQTGNRTFDYNFDGLAHAGLLPDLIEDLRRTGVTDDQLRPLFASAEAVVRMWEWIEGRGTPAPNASYQLSPPPNANGWNTTPVSVILSGSPLAGGSAIRQVRYSISGGDWIGVRGGSAALMVSSEGMTDIRFTVEDAAGHVTAEQTIHVQIDTIPPTTTATRSASPNARGWHNAAITVEFTGADEGSGLERCDAPVALTSEGAAQQARGTCSDRAGNISALAVEVNIDLTSPSAHARRSPAPNAHGWNNAPVTLAFDGEDALSGIFGCSADVVVSDDGANQSASGRCEDNAGNVSAQAVVDGINVDRMAPVLNGSRTAPNTHGWNNGPVTVEFACADALSGVAVTPETPQVVSGEGTAQQRMASCTDRAGNETSATVAGINLDLTPPLIVITQPGNNSSFGLGQPAAASYGCSDALSGVASCAGPVASGALVDTATAGVRTFTVTATDIAGNTAGLTHQYSIRYRFEGFLSPLNNLPTTNHGPAGRTFPVKWILRDASGASISDPAAISGVALVPSACDAVATDVTGEEASVNVGGLTYDPLTGVWHFNWQTLKSQVGCWLLELRLADGSVHAIAFDLR